MGAYVDRDAVKDFHRWLRGVDIDNIVELTYPDRKRVHNLKYYTWVEQQGKTFEEIQDQWYDPNYWTEMQAQVPEIDALIEEFNAKVGLI